MPDRTPGTARSQYASGPDHRPSDRRLVRERHPVRVELLPKRTVRAVRLERGMRRSSILLERPLRSRGMRDRRAVPIRTALRPGKLRASADRRRPVRDGWPMRLRRPMLQRRMQPAWREHAARQRDPGRHAARHHGFGSGSPGLDGCGSGRRICVDASQEGVMKSAQTASFASDASSREFLWDG